MCERSITYKTIGSLLAALLTAALLFTPVYAQEAAGAVPCMLTSWSGRGALLDESTLGDAAADAVRFVTGADVAVVCGGDIPDNALQPGVRTRQEIDEAFDKDRPIAVCQMTQGELWQLLEMCLAHITLDEQTRVLDMEASAFDGFPQISGITVRFDASAGPGQRIMQLRMEDGTELEPDGEGVLMVAASDHLLSGGYGTPAYVYERTDQTYSDAMAAYIGAGPTVDYTRTKRISMVGERANSLVSGIPYGVIVMLVVGLGLSGLISRSRQRKLHLNDWDDRADDPNDRPLL